MSGLFGTLSVALTGLSVSQQEMETTSNNVANANTPGYTREVSVTAAGDPVEVGSLSFGTGVVLEKIESLRDPMLQIQINQATQQNSSLNASLTQLQQIQTQFASSTSGIGADISNFFDSLQQLSTNPSDLTLRQGVLTAADTMATDFNTAAENLQTQRSNVDQNVVQSVSQVNSLTSQIASVDQQISNLQSINQNPGTLVDQQNNLIQQLSGLIGVQVIPTGQGITLAASNGTTLVSGSQSYALTTQPVIGSDGVSVQHIMAGPEDITGSLTGGSLAGLIQIRDQEIPSIGTSLDQLAAGLATNLNTANAKGFDLETSPLQGGNIFTPPPAGGVGAAATLTVSMTDPKLLAASSDGTPGSNGNLANLSAVADQVLSNQQAQTPIDFYSNLVSQVGSATANTSADADSSSLILQQLQDQNGSVSGVSLNEEAANLIQYQTAYQAASRVVSTVNLLLLDAVNLGMDAAEE
jgi:flagellar hook-associated protein 1